MSVCNSVGLSIDYNKLSIIDPPIMSRKEFTSLKKCIDSSFGDLISNYGRAIEDFFNPLAEFLVWFEKFLLSIPWVGLILLFCCLAYLGSRSWKLVAGTALSFLLVAYLNMWEATISTVATVSVATFLCILIGIPIGVWMARSDRVQTAITPILDIMQTIPSFVYLIPVVMLLGIGKAPALIAVMVYALPPMVRLTNLGIRLVDKEVLEAADSFGASQRQKLFDVQIPLALPNIFAGINQTIMMALAMVVIAAMIGAGGLGKPVLEAVGNLRLAQGVFNGGAIVMIAIIFDRVSQLYGKRLQKHREGGHGV